MSTYLPAGGGNVPPTTSDCSGHGESLNSVADHPKLIFIHSSDELYGADRVLIEMAKAAIGTVEAEVWLPNDLEHTARPLCQELLRVGVRVRHLPLPIMRRANRSFRGVAALIRTSYSTFRAFKNAHAQTVYCTTSPAFLAAPLARIAGIPRVVGHCQEIWSKSDRFVLSGPARACHVMLAISQAVVESMPASIRRRTSVVPNGTPEPVQVVPLSHHHGPLEYLVASRWNGWKGHRTLLSAWEQSGSPGHLVVLGGPPTSGASVDVQALKDALSHPETVTLIGEVRDTADYVDRADVILMPSDQPEPFGLVAIEAFARARPVIGSAAGGLLDIITQDQDGWLFPIQDTRELAAILGSLTRHRVTAAGSCARATYQDRYTLQRFVSAWKDAAFER